MEIRLLVMLIIAMCAAVAWAANDEGPDAPQGKPGKFPTSLKTKRPASQPSPVVKEGESLAVAGAKPGDPPVAGRAIVTHHTFESKSMNRQCGYNILLPPDYAKDDAKRYLVAKRYPVVYWCHGLNGHEYKDIASAIYPYNAMVAGELGPVIIVYVDGIMQSWYIDSADGKVLSETNIIKELIPHIDATYRTVATRDGRAVSGMSMGGYGCLHLAFKYPEVFSSVVAYGAAVFDRDSDDAAFKDNVFGTRQRFADEHPFTLLEKNVDKIRGKVAVRIVCGETDDMMKRVNLDLHNMLDKLNVKHEYETMPGLGHNIAGMYKLVGVKGLKFAVAAMGKPASRP